MIARRVLELSIVVSVSFIFSGCGQRATSTPPQALAAPNQAGVAVDPDDELVVKTIRPKRNAAIQVTVQQIGWVEAFFQANLRARASGVVRSIHKDLGDRVQRDELLVEIDVPDLERQIAQKESVVVQRQQEFRVAGTQLKDAEVARDVARSTVKQRSTEVAQMDATRVLRGKRLGRFRLLEGRQAISNDLVDEMERDYQSAVASVDAAKLGVERAEIDVREKEVKIEAAIADMDLKQALVDVARKDLDYARAQADYARIRAPFDGTILKRDVDPGSFVQNATTGQAEVLVTVARTDIVTVGAKFPDNVAPFVTRETEALIDFDELPGVTIACRVTRFSPSIQNQDRSMKVEVDLFNGDEAAYRRLMTKALSAQFAPLAGTGALGLTAVALRAESVLDQDRKGTADFFPRRAVSLTAGATEPRLLPGMTATMRLKLRRFAGFVIPSSAIYSRGGRPQLLLVVDGMSKQVPIKVQVDDGTVAKVSMIRRARDASGTEHELLEELTGQEEIVASRQAEVGDKVPVKPSPNDW